MTEAPKKHVFVCVQNRPVGHQRGSCQGRDSPSVYRAFVEARDQEHLSELFRLTHSGCLGPCTCGPSVLVYPEGVLYGGVTPEDVPTIIEQHLKGGHPIQRLAVREW